MMGTFGDPFDVRDPTMLQVLAYHPDAAADDVLAALDDEIGRLAEGVEDEELARVVTSLVSDDFRHLDNLLDRATTFAVLEQQRGRPDLVNELPEAMASVTPEAVVKVAAEWLQRSQRAVLEVRPGGQA